MMLGAACAMCLVLASGVPRPLATAMSTTSHTLTTTQAGSNELVTEAEAAAEGALLGIMVFDRQTDQVVLEHDADRRFTTASLVKVLIALDWMQQIAGGGRPSAAETRQIKQMLSSSDDPTASELWMAAGGPGIVTRAINRMGLEHTEPPAEPGRWGDTLISAADMVRVYRYLMEEAPAAHREIVLDALRNMTPRGSDGYDQTFGIPDAAGNRPWAVKQGWSCCIDYLIRHTSGLVGPDDRYIVVVLTAHSLSTPKAVADDRTTAVTAAVLRALEP